MFTSIPGSCKWERIPHQALSYSQGSRETSYHMIPTQQQSLDEPINFKHIYKYMADQSTYVINKIDSKSTDIQTKFP